jgi:hypothetical protein
MKSETPETNNVNERENRRAYEAPRLLEYGPVEELTQLGGSI